MKAESQNIRTSETYIHLNTSELEEGNIYKFSFVIPDELVLGELPECIKPSERSIIFNKDGDIQEILELLTRLLLRGCTTDIILYNYGPIILDLFARGLNIQDEICLCEKHGDLEVLNLLGKTQIQTTRKQGCLKRDYAGKFISKDYPADDLKGFRALVFWSQYVIACGEVVPVCPHLSVFATNALKMNGFLESCIDVFYNNKCLDILKKLLRSLYRLLKSSASTFSSYIPFYTLTKFARCEDHILRSYSLNCISLIEGWPDSSIQKYLKSFEFNLSEDQALKYYTVSLQEEKINATKRKEIFLRSILPQKKNHDSVILDSSSLSSNIVEIAGVLLYRKHENFCIKDNDKSFVDIPSRVRHMHQFSTALSMGNPILLEGPPGSGKTGLVEFFAEKFSYRDLYRIVLNEQSDPKSLVGVYVCSSEPGIFTWKPGVLTTAVTEGKWILIENIDLAPREIMSMLTPLLDSKSLFIPSSGETVAANTGFQIIATCTSSPLGAEKNVWHHIKLPDLSDDEILCIMQQRFPEMASYNQELMQSYRLAQKTYRTIGAHHGHKKLTCRHMMKLGNRLNAINALNADDFKVNMFKDTIDCFFSSIYSENLLAQCCLEISAIYKIDNYSVNQLYLKDYVPKVVLNAEAFKIGRLTLPIVHAKREYFSESNTIQNLYSACPKFAFTSFSLRYLERLASCCLFNEPVLMVGETGTGKTTLVQTLASILGKKLHVINMSQESESSDLLGGFKPVSEMAMASSLYAKFKILFSKSFKTESNLLFMDIMERAINKRNCKHLVRGFEKALDTVRNIQANSTNADGSCSNNIQYQQWSEFEKELREFNFGKSRESPIRFAFVEGLVSKAISEGDFLLIDEINLATKETLDHLSTLIESNTGSIILQDKGVTSPIRRNPGFRLFACMNPSNDFGKKDLDVVLRSRFTEFWIESLVKNVEELKLVVAKYLNECLPSSSTERQEIINDVADFYIKISNLSERAEISDGSDRKANFSPRTLVRGLSFASQMTPIYGIYRSIYEGLCLSFLSSLNSDSKNIVNKLIKNKYKINSDRIPTAPPDSVLVGSFWLKIGPLGISEDQNEKFIITPSVETGLRDLARAVACGKHSILLQGPTSVGKTSTIEFLGRKVGHKVIRINNHQHTEIQEYIGTWCSNDKGELVFVEGHLLKALREGYWLILDELNMAPSEILEALDRLLDDNRELLVTEIQKVVKPHPKFMLFATQNPPGNYSGRKHLSRSLRNRFLELHFSEIPNNELLELLSKRCKIAPSYAKKMVNIYTSLQSLRSKDHIFEGKYSLVTLRDIFKWADREMSSIEDLAINGWFIIGERVRKLEDKEIVRDIIEKETKVNLNLDEIYEDYFQKIVKTLPNENIGVAWTSFFKRIFILTHQCIINREPVLLIGDTGVGKTTLIQFISKIMGKELRIINVHQNTDVQDLIGGQRPVRNKGLIETKLDECIKNAEVFLRENYSGISDQINEQENLSSITSCLKEAISSPGDDPGMQELRNKASEYLVEIEKLSVRMKDIFCWHNGPLVNAMQEGSFLLIDEISLADSAVIERINSVLEFERTLVLAEKGADENVILSSEDFRIFATMNPSGDYGKKDISPALRSRFTEIWAPRVISEDDIKMIIEVRFLELSGDRKNCKILSSWILEFANWTSKILKKDRDEIFSVRDLVCWTQFVTNSMNELGIERAFINGGCMIFTDKIDNGSFTQKNGLVQKCKLKLAEIALNGEYDPDAEFVKILSEPTEEYRYFGKSPFSLESNPKDFQEVSARYSLSARITRVNMGRVMRAMILDRPILLEGPPGAGKTSLVMALAALSGNKITRINLSDQTDLMDLFGSDLPQESFGVSGHPEFSWCDGPFLKAMKNGEWVLLDELNLADQMVLEGLNSCLDHRKEVYIPELDLTFKKKSGFRIFAAQNPPSSGDGRKGLPRSFLNRFSKVYMNEMLEDDNVLVMCSMFKDVLPKCVIEKICKFNTLVSREVSLGRICANMKAPEFNIRNLVRWIDIMQADNIFEAENYVNMLYLQSLRSSCDKYRVKMIFEEVFSHKLETKNIKFSVNEKYLKVGNSIFQRNEGLLNNSKSLEALEIISSRLPYIESVLKCIQMGYVALITGPQNSGKTSLIRAVSRLCNVNTVEISINSSTDISDILGTFEQVDIPKMEENLKSDFLMLLKYISWKLFETELMYAVVDLYRELTEIKGLDVDNLEKIKSLFVNIRKISELGNLGADQQVKRRINSILNKLDRISYARQNNKGFFWVDGPLTRAVEEGHWVVLDNVNTCPASILDRLNSLFEASGQLILIERGPVNGEFRRITPHKNFRAFMCIDPKFGELSQAMRNRSVEIFLSNDLIEQESDPSMIYLDIKRLLSAHGVSGPMSLVTSEIYNQICNVSGINPDLFSKTFLNFSKTLSNNEYRCENLEHNAKRAIQNLCASFGIEELDTRLKLKCESFGNIPYDFYLRNSNMAINSNLFICISNLISQGTLPYNIMKSSLLLLDEFANRNDRVVRYILHFYLSDYPNLKTYMDSINLCIENAHEILSPKETFMKMCCKEMSESKILLSDQIFLSKYDLDDHFSLGLMKSIMKALDLTDSSLELAFSLSNLIMEKKCTVIHLLIALRKIKNTIPKTERFIDQELNLEDYDLFFKIWKYAGVYKAPTLEIATNERKLLESFYSPENLNISERVKVAYQYAELAFEDDCIPLTSLSSEIYNESCLPLWNYIALNNELFLLSDLIGVHLCLSEIKVERVSEHVNLLLRQTNRNPIGISPLIRIAAALKLRQGFLEHLRDAIISWHEALFNNSLEIISRQEYLTLVVKTINSLDREFVVSSIDSSNVQFRNLQKALIENSEREMEEAYQRLLIFSIIDTMRVKLNQEEANYKLANCKNIIDIIGTIADIPHVSKLAKFVGDKFQNFSNLKKCGVCLAHLSLEFVNAYNIQTFIDPLEYQFSELELTDEVEFCRDLINKLRHDAYAVGPFYSQGNSIKDFQRIKTYSRSCSRNELRKLFSIFTKRIEFDLEEAFGENNTFVQEVCVSKIKSLRRFIPKFKDLISPLMLALHTFRHSLKLVREQGEVEQSLPSTLLWYTNDYHDASSVDDFKEVADSLAKSGLALPVIKRLCVLLAVKGTYSSIYDKIKILMSSVSKLFLEEKKAEKVKEEHTNSLYVSKGEEIIEFEKEFSYGRSEMASIFNKCAYYIMNTTKFGEFNYTKFKKLWDSAYVEGYNAVKDLNLTFYKSSSIRLDVIVQERCKKAVFCGENFYVGPNFVQANMLRIVCKKIRKKLDFLLSMWNDHNALLVLKALCERMESYSADEPVSRFLYAVLIFLQKAYDWENYSPSKYSISSEIQECIALVISWREKEALFWKNLLLHEKNVQEEELISRMWPYLWELVMNEDGKIVNLLNDFVMGASIGDYQARLKLLEILWLASKKHEVYNIWECYSNLIPMIEKEIQPSFEILEKLNAHTSTYNLKNVSYWTMKEAYDVRNRKFMKILKLYRENLSRSIRPIFENWPLQSLYHLFKRNGEVDCSLGQTGDCLFSSSISAVNNAIDAALGLKLETSQVKDIKEYKAERNIRKAGFLRLLKDLNNAGLSHRKFSELDSKEESIFETCRGDGTSRFGQLFHIGFLKVQKARICILGAHEDVKQESNKCIGYLLNALNIIVKLRQIIIPFSNDLNQLEVLHSRVNNIDEEYVLCSEEVIHAGYNCKNAMEDTLILLAQNYDKHNILEDLKVTKQNFDMFLGNTIETKVLKMKEISQIKKEISTIIAKLKKSGLTGFAKSYEYKVVEFAKKLEKCRISRTSPQKVQSNRLKEILSQNLSSCIPIHDIIGRNIKALHEFDVKTYVMSSLNYEEALRDALKVSGEYIKMSKDIISQALLYYDSLLLLLFTISDYFTDIFINGLKVVLPEESRDKETNEQEEGTLGADQNAQSGDRDFEGSLDDLDVNENDGDGEDDAQEASGDRSGSGEDINFPGGESDDCDNQSEVTDGSALSEMGENGGRDEEPEIVEDQGLDKTNDEGIPQEDSTIESRGEQVLGQEGTCMQENNDIQKDEDLESIEGDKNEGEYIEKVEEDGTDAESGPEKDTSCDMEEENPRDEPNDENLDMEFQETDLMNDEVKEDIEDNTEEIDNDSNEETDINAKGEIDEIDPEISIDDNHNENEIPDDRYFEDNDYGSDGDGEGQYTGEKFGEGGHNEENGTCTRPSQPEKCQQPISEKYIDNEERRLIRNANEPSLDSKFDDTGEDYEFVDDNNQDSEAQAVGPARSMSFPPNVNEIYVEDNNDERESMHKKMEMDSLDDETNKRNPPLERKDRRTEKNTTAESSSVSKPQDQQSKPQNKIGDFDAKENKIDCSNESIDSEIECDNNLNEADEYTHEDLSENPTNLKPPNIGDNEQSSEDLLRENIYEKLCRELHSEGISEEVKLQKARELWQTLSIQTNAQTARLSEQLQLILKPVLASRLKGDYKTGKRLNMRKVVAYVASSYKKDRIWLQRTRPGKRSYQVLLCLDDSLSMSEAKCVQLAYKSLIMVSRALVQAEVGNVGIISFGESLKLLHPFDKPITDDEGGRILSRFTFKQKKTLMSSMFEDTLNIFSETDYLAPQSTINNIIDLRRLQIIISDGICENHKKIRSLARVGTDMGLMTVFIILDTRNRGESIVEIKNVAYKEDQNGSRELNISSYMDTFPFDYFVIIRNIEMLPDIISDVIKQYVELSSQEWVTSASRI